MRTTIITLAFLLATTATHAAPFNRACRGDSLKPEGDKLVHLTYSAGIGVASRAVIADPALAFAAALAPGLVRELWLGDCFSFQDMAYNAVGAAIGVTTTHWVIGPNRVVFRTEF